MNGFVNREASNINKKRLEVESVEYGTNGDIASMDVYVSRIDNPSVEGTRLDKESIESAIVNYVYSTVFGLNFTSNHKKITIQQNSTASLIVGFENKVFYPEVVKCGGCSISAETCDEAMIVEFSYLNGGSNTYTDDYAINLYSDAALTHYVCQIRGFITYNPPSTGSTD